MFMYFCLWYAFVCQVVFVFCICKYFDDCLASTGNGGLRVNNARDHTGHQADFVEESRNIISENRDLKYANVNIHSSNKQLESQKIIPVQLGTSNFFRSSWIYCMCFHCESEDQSFTFFLQWKRVELIYHLRLKRSIRRIRCAAAFCCSCCCPCC